MARPPRPALPILLTAIVFGILLTVPCCQPSPTTTDRLGNGSSTGGDDDFESAIMNAANLDAWLAAVTARPAGYVAPRTVYSTELIQDAYESDRITEEKYYVLRMTEMFDHENLEPQYRAEPDPRRSATSFLREASSRYDEFPRETQEALWPYLAPFDDPQSFWYRADDVVYPFPVETAKNSSGVRDMDRPTASGDYFEISGEPGLDVEVTVISEALNTSYEAFLDLGFTEPTDWIEVKVRADIGSSTIAGEQTFHVTEGRRRCNIVISAGQSDDDLRGTAAHELFHCFQEYVEADTTVTHAAWVWDSSAVWAEEFAFPNGNSEHTYDTTFFSSLETYLFDSDGTRHYASYPFWFFMYQRDGKTGNAVRDLYLEIQEHGTIEAISARPNFYEEFKEYALWNLNSDPHKYYEDADGEPSLRPSGSSIQHTTLQEGQTIADPVILQSGAIIYYVYTFDDDVDRVRFDLTDIQKDEDNENGIQAVYRIDGEWSYEDVSYRDELVFCRSRESENVEGVILIISNGKMDESSLGSLISEDLPIGTTEKCIPRWHGNVECS